MLVKAKCITRAWDSLSAVMYEPGAGPLPDGLYEIDRDGPLAKLKLGSTYVFQFDRNCGPDDKPHVYACKREGCEGLKAFKTLNDLGTHTRTEHKEIRVEDDEEEEEEDVSDRTCYICIPPKTLKNAYGLRLHNEKSHPFESQPQVIAEIAVPA